MPHIQRVADAAVRTGCRRFDAAGRPFLAADVAQGSLEDDRSVCFNRADGTVLQPVEIGSKFFGSGDDT